LKSPDRFFSERIGTGCQNLTAIYCPYRIYRYLHLLRKNKRLREKLKLIRGFFVFVGDLGLFSSLMLVEKDFLQKIPKKCLQPSPCKRLSILFFFNTFLIPSTPILYFYKIIFVQFFPSQFTCF
jgi:hypothetical protein